MALAVYIALQRRLRRRKQQQIFFPAVFPNGHDGMLRIVKNENQCRRYLIVALGEIIFAQFSLSNQPFGCGVVIEISGHMRFSPFDTRMPYHGKNTRNGLGEMRLNLVPPWKGGIPCGEHGFGRVGQIIMEDYGGNMPPDMLPAFAGLHILTEEN